MTAGPGDQMASPAGGRGRLRASHADREQVIEVLKVAFVQGRLDQDEFETRVGQTLAARTYLELAALTADIPARLAAAEPTRTGENKLAKAGLWATMAAGLIGVMSVSLVSGGNPAERLTLVAVLIPMMALMITGLLLLHSWLDQHATGEPPPGPHSPGPHNPGPHSPTAQRPAGTGHQRNRAQ